MTGDAKAIDALGSGADGRAPASHQCNVFAAMDIHVVSGANLGDGLGAPDDLAPGDVYMLDPAAKPMTLALDHAAETAPDTAREDNLAARPEILKTGARTSAGHAAVCQTIAAGSQIGVPGEGVTLLAQLTLMAPDGDRLEILLLRVSGTDGTEGSEAHAATYALPLSSMAPRTEYTLLQTAPPPRSARLTDLMCLSFLRGVRVMLASGEQVAIETLQPGQRILTRDHGAQPLRWIGRTTLRARGSFSPVVIPAGALGNIGDLIVGPNHRLFVYLRNRPAGVPTAELLVQARLLTGMNGIFRREGGFSDFFSLVFDRHEIIYAEGLPVESLMVHEATVARLPEALAEMIREIFPDLSQDQHFGTEASGALIRTLQSGEWLSRGAR